MTRTSRKFGITKNESISRTSMNWKELTQEESLKEIQEASNQKPIFIFKHSTRCNISAMALSRLERAWKEDELPNTDAYYLDLIRYREVSNAIESVFGIRHQSPQALVISGGKCVHETTHMGISYNDIKKQITERASVTS